MCIKQLFYTDWNSLKLIPIEPRLGKNFCPLFYLFSRLHFNMNFYLYKCVLSQIFIRTSRPMQTLITLQYVKFNKACKLIFYLVYSIYLLIC